MVKNSYRQQKLLIYIVTVIVLGLGYFLRWQWQEVPIAIPRGELVSLVATLKTEPRVSFDRQVLLVGDARVYTNFFPRYSVGDRLKIYGKVDEKGRMFNPQIEKLQKSQKSKMSQRLIILLAQLRNRLSQNIYSLLPSREATLVVGSVLGVDNISQEFRDQLINTGTIHVVVVSGQNLALVAGMFFAMGNILGRRKSLVLATLAVFFYALLAGFAPPVVRASLMVLMASVAVFLGRETSAVWSLLLAALVILFVWPSAILETSFQLTFAATLGILTMGQKLSRLGEKLLGLKQRSDKGIGHLSHLSYLGNLFLENAAISISAYIFTAPLIFWHFGRVTAIAPLVNVLVAEAVFPIMVFGFLTAAASLVFMPLAQIFAWFAYVPALYFSSVVGLFAAIG